MRKSLIALLLTFGASAAMASTTAPASTASAPKALSSSQSRMVQCNKAATGKAGADRKAFMKDCLKSKAASTPVATNAAPAASTASAASGVSLKK